MLDQWFIGVSPDKRKDTEEAIRHSTIVLRQLRAALEKEIALLDMVKLEDYDTPSWPYKQADRLGQLRAFRRILNLLTL